MSSRKIWWEKTVEYKFVLEADRQLGLAFATPLSGVEERAAGDGIFSAGSRLVLIEFKRSDEELDSDKEKFTDYERAAQIISSQDGHHFLVFGSYDESNGGGELHLYANTYFSRMENLALSVFEKGVSPEVFNEYLEELIKWKKEDGRSSGMVSPESISSVVGVSSHGVSSISLTEYVRLELPHLYHEPTPALPSGPSPGFS